mmetsp:Transcript_66348/g.156193  ORF Transcript_66348/g.156193 Transcript_66348/m.156193 type:complete len:251 (-) Transcript_66348:499-1251(-)
MPQARHCCESRAPWDPHHLLDAVLEDNRAFRKLYPKRPNGSLHPLAELLDAASPKRWSATANSVEDCTDRPHIAGMASCRWEPLHVVSVEHFRGTVVVLVGFGDFSSGDQGQEVASEPQPENLDWAEGAGCDDKHRRQTQVKVVNTEGVGRCQSREHLSQELSEVRFPQGFHARFQIPQKRPAINPVVDQLQTVLILTYFSEGYDVGVVETAERLKLFYNITWLDLRRDASLWHRQDRALHSGLDMYVPC